MKLFLSWSGERSKAVALSLRTWIPLILHYAEPWMSEKDIAAGKRWAVEIAKELDGANFGIIILTRENIGAPWILFEAGALSKAFSSECVCPYLVDLEFQDIVGPLSQFQSKKAEKVSTLELLHAINTSSSDSIESSRLVALFEALWPQLESILKRTERYTAKPETLVRRAQADVLEDLVEITRRMETRFDQLEKLVHKSLPQEEVPEIPRRHTSATVIVVTQDRSPHPKEGAAFEFHPVPDLINGLCTVSGLDPREFGNTWHLLDQNSQPLTVEDCRQIASQAKQGERHVLWLTLEDGLPNPGPQPDGTAGAAPRG